MLCMEDFRQLYAIIKKFQSLKNGSKFVREKVPFRKSGHLNMCLCFLQFQWESVGLPYANSHYPKMKVLNTTSDAI